MYSHEPKMNRNANANGNDTTHTILTGIWLENLVSNTLSALFFRYGLPDKPLELGRVTPGTYCTRQFDECYRNKCRLQSPNYPGMYPRNVTCYWTIRQKEVPTSKHAMIAVSQENQHKALVKR